MPQTTIFVGWETTLNLTNTIANKNSLKMRFLLIHFTFYLEDLTDHHITDEYNL